MLSLATIGVVFDVFRANTGCGHGNLHRDEGVRREIRKRVKWLLVLLARYFAISPRH